MDESHIGTNKCHRAANNRQGIWVIGEVERGTNRVFLKK